MMRLYIDFSHDRPAADRVRGTCLVAKTGDIGEMIITWDHSRWEYIDGQTAGWCEGISVNGEDKDGFAEELNQLKGIELHADAEDEWQVNDIKILNLIFTDD